MKDALLLTLAYTSFHLPYLQVSLGVHELFWLESTLCYHVSGSNVLKVDVKIELRLETQSLLNMQYFKYVMIGCQRYLFRPSPPFPKKKTDGTKT